jgi:hypothetical protein
MLSFLKNIYSAIAAGRQAQADHEIARLLHRNEYRNRDFTSVLTAVQTRNLGSLRDD